MNQYDDVKLEEVDVNDPPNWAVHGWNSRSEAIEGVLEYMKKRQAIFDHLGLQGDPVKKIKERKK